MKQVVIDCFPESAAKYGPEWAVVAIDVIRATTSAITVAAMGRDCFPCADLEESLRRKAELGDPLMVGELAGDMPDGFHMNNSPHDLYQQTDDARPVVLLSTSGTRLISLAGQASHIYLACFRNFSATAKWLAANHDRIAVIGAGSRGEFREEDQICCAWLADRLVQAGFHTPDDTHDIINKWRNCTSEACMLSNSVRYLQRSGQERDIPFVLNHVDDLPTVYRMEAGKVTACQQPVAAETPSALEAAHCASA